MHGPASWMIVVALAAAASVVSAFEVRPVCGVRGEALGAGVAFGGGVQCEVVTDPLGCQGQVARVTYPTYEKGKAEWPAVYFRSDALATRDWHEWDALRLVILNPSDDVVDVGLCVSGAMGRYNVHVKLQPSVWNYRVYPIADIAAQTGVDAIRQVDVFMTRPAQDHTVFIKGLDLVGTRLPADASVPLRYVFGSFEDDDELLCWNRNGVEVEPSNEKATDGSHSLLLTFPAYAAGRPPWPSLQAWVAAGAVETDDWSAYDTIEFDVVSTTEVDVPLKVYLRDAGGSIFSQSTAIAPGESVTHTIRLDETGLDTSRMRQVDLFMSKPSRDYSFYLDSVRLVARPQERLVASVEMIRQVREQLAGLPDEERRPFAQKVAALDGAVRAAAAEVAGPTATVEALRAMRSAVRDVKAWVSGSSRDVVAAKARLAARQQAPGALFGVGIADSMTKVMIRDMSLEGVGPAPEARLELAANEFESLQVVVLGAVRALENVRVDVSPLTAEGGATLPADAVTVSVVGYVETKKPPYAVSYVGWWPDPILDFQQTAAVNPGEAVPFWVRVHAPPDAKAGVYRGRLTVSADGAADVSLPFSVRVFGFGVPEAPVLPTATDFRNHIKQVYGELPEADHAAKVAQFRDLFIRHKIDFDRIYRQPRNDPENLDLYLDDLKDLRDRGLLRAFNICYVGTDRKVADPDHPNVQQTIDKALTTLRYWVPILEKEKLLEYAYVYGYDEVKPEVFPVIAKVFGTIKAEFPGIPLMTTAYDHSFGTDSVLGDAVDIFVPLTPRFAPEMVAKARAQGRDVWWYICIGPKHPYANWLIEYDAIEARLLMGMMTAKYRPGGFLYYALTRWPVNKQPIESGPYTNWNPMSYKENNGDGSLFCAGPDGPLATIRAENFRDGMEDYAYFVLLEELVAAAEKVPAGRRSTRLSEALRRGKAGLTVGESVVASMNDFTRDPAVLRGERARVAGLIEDLRAALGR